MLPSTLNRLHGHRTWTNEVTTSRTAAIISESWRTNQEPHRHRHEYTSLILSVKPYPIIFVRTKAASPWKGIESVFVIPTVVESLLMLRLSWFEKGTNSSTASSTIVFVEFFHWRGKYTIVTITIVGTCKSRLSWWVMVQRRQRKWQWVQIAGFHLHTRHKLHTPVPLLRVESVTVAVCRRVMSGVRSLCDAIVSVENGATSKFLES